LLYNTESEGLDAGEKAELSWKKQVNHTLSHGF
jgi:hypothetical protein